MHNHTYQKETCPHFFSKKYIYSFKGAVCHRFASTSIVNILPRKLLNGLEPSK